MPRSLHTKVVETLEQHRGVGLTSGEIARHLHASEDLVILTLNALLDDPNERVECEEMFGVPILWLIEP